MEAETIQHSQQVIDIAKKYDKWVEWSDEDKFFIGQCPNLGIMCHYENNPTNEIATYKDMLNLIYNVIEDALVANDLPKPTSFTHLYAAQD